MVHSALVFAFSTVLAATSGGKTPDDLAGSIESAIVAGDVNALLATADLEDSPPVAQFPFVKLIADCTGGTTCKVTAKPLDPQSEAELRDHARRVGEGMELPAKLDGMIEVIGRNNKDASAVSLRLAYAKVRGEYKVEAGRYAAATLAELRATTARAEAEKTLKKGIWVPATRKSDTTWLETSTALPPDGGEPGKALVVMVKALATAVATEDVDAAAALLGDWGGRVLGPTDYKGNAVPLADRKRRLRMQARRLLLDVRVMGGWQRGDEAMVVMEGVSGSGWILRGATKMARVDGQWKMADGYAVEVPPN